jgi:hypothetical protein
MGDNMIQDDIIAYLNVIGAAKARDRARIRGVKMEKHT